MKNLKTNILAWAIAIVLVIFVSVGISTFYSSPDYEECYRPITLEGPNVKISAEEIQEQKVCMDKNNALREAYEKNVFLIYLVAGFIALIIGLILKGNKIVSFGLGVGGLGNIIVGFLRYWRYLGDYVRFIAVGILLALLIWFAYKKIR